ncbi:MAG: hypothetical protein RIQ70_742 [Bacteroidota bacterium]|jgi:biotin carboxyl carrier protein
MLKIKVNQSSDYVIEKDGNQILINGIVEIFDSILLADGRFHILKDNISYTVEVLEINKPLKELLLKINGVEYQVTGKDKFDLLMEQMGISTSTASKHEQLKAPMPGKVLEIKVSVGQEVKQGEPLLILEAMKMENVLKASHDVTVAEINIKQGDTVDKGQVLLAFG